jgi:O-antigen ligase
MNALRVGIFGLITFAVLSHGAVEAWSRAALESGAAILFFLWAGHFLFTRRDQSIVLPGLLYPLAGFALLAAAQPLFGVTASRFSTRMELLLVCSILATLFVSAQVFRSVADWRAFAWFAMILAFLVAGFGILQHLTFNGKLYWFREMRYGGIPFGPYVNRNHFAGFLELLLPVSLVPFISGKVRRERLIFVGILVVVPVIALVLSASRGGLIAFAAELIFLLLVLALRRTHGRHLIAGGAVLLVALATVSWIGVKQVLSRFSSLQGMEVTEGKRASMRSGTWHIFLDHPVVGTGLGTLQQVYPPYETLFDGKIVNHTHNDYLETLAETGTTGAIFCAWFLGIVLLRAVRFLQSSEQSFAATLHLSGFTACWGLLVHSLVDFNLHIPANLLLFSLMCLLATTNIEEPARRRASPQSSEPAAAPRQAHPSSRRHRVAGNA